MYINDLPNCLEKSNVSMYADDTCLCCSFDSVDAINQAINADLIALKGWLEGKKLSLNVAKTEAMINGSNKKLHKIYTPDAPKPQFRIGCEDVRLLSDVKYLGVQLDQELKWTNHFTTVTKMISRGIGILRYAKQYLPPATIETMYRSLEEPYFRYCCPVWGNAGVSIIGKLQKLQNRAAKLITNSPFDASPFPVIRALGWSTVREIIDLESARIVYKSLNGDAQSYMSDMFTKVNVSTTRSLRNSDYDLRVPFLRTTKGQRCFSYQGAKLWNGLSKKNKHTSALKNFMKAIK